VLAVGDEAFQTECSAKIDEFREQGKTTVFVPHALDTIKSLCEKSILLDHGRTASTGNTEKVIGDYQTMLSKMNQ
jgi:ABC-type polysaccharide/polyol phosphate transport system ATPase subunit